MDRPEVIEFRTFLAHFGIRPKWSVLEPPGSPREAKMIDFGLILEGFFIDFSLIFDTFLIKFGDHFLLEIIKNYEKSEGVFLLVWLKRIKYISIWSKFTPRPCGKFFVPSAQSSGSKEHNVHLLFLSACRACAVEPQPRYIHGPTGVGSLTNLIRTACINRRVFKCLGHGNYLLAFYGLRFHIEGKSKRTTPAQDPRQEATIL